MNDSSKEENQNSSSDRFQNTEALGADSGYQRLEHLYEITKYLANFESVEKTFPAIWNLVAETFPIRSTVLVEMRSGRPKTFTWQIPGLSEIQINSTVSKARSTFDYFLNLVSSERTALQLDLFKNFAIGENQVANQFEQSDESNLVSFPLLVGSNFVFGIIQFEGLKALNEQDLRFANALTNLIAVAFDRHHRDQEERNEILKAGNVVRSERDDSRRLVKELEEERSKLKAALRKIEYAANELDGEKKKLTQMIEVSPSGIGLMRGPTFIFERVNLKFTQLVSEREYIGRTWQEVFTEFPNSAILGYLKSVYETGHSLSHSELKISFESAPGLFKDRYFDSDYYRILDHNGAPYGIVLQSSDVTERVLSRLKLEESERQLRQNQEMLASAIAVSKIGFYDRDVKKNTSTFSKQMIADWGIQSGGTRAENFKHVHPDDRKRLLFQMNESEQSRNPLNSEFRVVRPDGKMVWMEIKGKYSYDAQGNAIRFFGTSRNISTQKEMQHDLEEAKRSSDRANQAKSAFLANMSHEIRTPLGAIMGFVELLKDSSLPRDTSANYIEILDRNSHHLMRIIDDVLDLAKVEAGKIILEKIEFSLVEFLNDFSSFMKMKARENGIDFDFKADGLLPDILLSDPTRIRQILTNMVGNAIKFTEKGEVNLVVAYHHDRLIFRVHDTGRGISQEQRKNLFVAFTQADSSTTRKYGGSGLGLFLTKKLSNAMGGDFLLTESEIGKGSTFETNISVGLLSKTKFLTAEEFQPIDKLKLQIHSPHARLIDLEILLVEDSIDNQLLFRHILKSTGAKLKIASDGIEGFEEAGLHHYDVILMDIQMPRMDGYQAVAKLRANGFSGPIVALTAHAMIEERIRALNSGFSHFLTKPVDREGLINLLGQIYDQQKSSRRISKTDSIPEHNLLH